MREQTLWDRLLSWLFPAHGSGPSDAPFYLAVTLFWVIVVFLVLGALVSLRRARLDATAAALWTMWIVLVPVVGAVTYFIVRPGRREG